MNKLQKWGGVAAIYEAVAYITGMVVFLLAVDYASAVSSAQKIALVVENQAVLAMTNVVIYVLFGVALVVLSLALHQRLKAASPAMMQTATAFGLIWAGVVIASGMVFNVGMGVVTDLYAADPTQATAVWTAIDAVANGIGGGVELLGGLWTLLVSLAALRAGAFGKGLNYLGILVGIAGTMTIIPALGEIGGMIFGLTQIVWFAWLGIAMLRQPKITMQEVVTPAFE
ncbi:MAG: DUF4386 family protein [Chloroflexi bacterium]|nr:DUF4386 family protein [Chloroflexota bacterium]